MCVYLTHVCQLSYVYSVYRLRSRASLYILPNSGGNKRKLSAAISLVGDPPVVLLVSETDMYDGYTHCNPFYTVYIYVSSEVYR